MYVGLGFLLVGEAVMLPSIGTQMLIMILALWVVVNGFVLLYEEPKLRELFGDEYKIYCDNVRRWLPRLTPFDNADRGALPSLHLE
jgi:protein-S-isoprenylcysteine O-methyltransferase Ste14